MNHEEKDGKIIVLIFVLEILAMLFAYIILPWEEIAETMFAVLH